VLSPHYYAGYIKISLLLVSVGGALCVILSTTYEPEPCNGIPVGGESERKVVLSQQVVLSGYHSFKNHLYQAIHF